MPWYNSLHQLEILLDRIDVLDIIIVKAVAKAGVVYWNVY